MRGLLKFVLIVAGNVLALWLANLYVPGFVLSGTWYQIAFVALIFSLLNGFLKPILKFVLGPIIVLTLGIALVVVNAIILYILPILVNHIDFLQGSIIIQDIPALVYATLIVSAVNFIIHLSA
jgi:putative membrane protein